jgi:5-methylcytosine-specific restriction endonuclease McrA
MKTKKKVIKKKRTLSEWRKDNPLKYRVQNFMSTLKKTGEWVPERVDILKHVESSLNESCPYCSINLTTENISLDHVVPKTRSVIKAHMNWLSNLQCVCRECNQVKGEFTDYEFVGILNWLESDCEPIALTIFRKRMKMATMVYGRRR